MSRRQALSDQMSSRLLPAHQEGKLQAKWLYPSLVLELQAPAV